MKRWRVLAAGLGLVVLGAAIAGVGAGVATAAVEGLVGLLGNDYLLAAAVAALALAVTVPVAISARASALDQATMPTPEATLAMPRPGADVDDALESSVALVPYVSRERKDAVRREFRQTAVSVVARRDSCSRDDAIERVAEGSWTTDDAAAAFLATEDAATGALARTDGVDAHLRALAGGDTLFQRRARRTAEVIAAESSTGPDRRRGRDRDDATENARQRQCDRAVDSGRTDDRDRDDSGRTDRRDDRGRTDDRDDSGRTDRRDDRGRGQHGVDRRRDSGRGSGKTETRDPRTTTATEGSR